MENNKMQCSTCKKDKITYFCRGCLKEYCFLHLEEHRQAINGDLDEIVNDFNQFQQEIHDGKQNSILIKQINEWEQESIEKIQ
ncbi:hypothetical protein I4U23_011363 [Adineta vaga]|nr:hypothetical protein I4U23_011363 [Adineta vaga]